MRPPLRTTHTFVKLEVSATAFDEIQQKLVDADYMQCFIDDAIEMSGIGIVRGPERDSAYDPDSAYVPVNTSGSVSTKPLDPARENGGAGENGGLLVTDALPACAKCGGPFTESRPRVLVGDVACGYWKPRFAAHQECIPITGNGSTVSGALPPVAAALESQRDKPMGGDGWVHV